MTLGGDHRYPALRRLAGTRISGRWARIACAVALMFAASGATAAATAPRVDAAARTVRVGVYQNQPKIFVDESGHASGIFIDLIEAIGAEEGWTIVYVPCAWDDCLASLRAGGIDLMPDVAHSSDRDVEFDFHHTPVLDSWSQIYSDPRLNVRDFSDLAGKRVAVLKGSIQQAEFEKYMRGFGFNVTIVPTTSLEDAFALTAHGSADAAIANRYFGDYYYRQYGLNKTPIVFQPSTLFYATAQGKNADLLEAIDRDLNSWLQEPSSPYYTALSRWTGAAPAPAATSVPLYFYLAIAAIGALLAASVAGLFFLRRQVRARTRRLQQANQALVESERKYRELVELANIIILRWTKDGRIAFVNEFGLKFFGYAADELVGRPIMETIVPASSAEGMDMAQLMVRIAADPAAFEQNVNENMRRDGERVWVAWSNRVVWDANDQITEILSVGTTSRRRREPRTPSAI